MPLKLISRREERVELLAVIYRVFQNDATIPHRNNGIGNWQLSAIHSL
jgi:hypothetical protein